MAHHDKKDRKYRQWLTAQFLATRSAVRANVLGVPRNAQEQRILLSLINRAGIGHGTRAAAVADGPQAGTPGEGALP